MTKREISPKDKQVGRRIRELRKDLLQLDSQQEFADRLGSVTRGAVGNWELGKGIKRENIQRIAAVFGISFEWLATGRGDPRAGNQQIEVTPSDEEFQALWEGADENARRSAMILLRAGQKPSTDQ